MTSPESAGRMKVFGGATFAPGGAQQRTIVAASSQKAAVQALKDAGIPNITLGEFRGYWAVTHNEDELRIALESPLTVFRSSDRWKPNFHPLTRHGG